ncbi:uncharacterized protein L201_000017 [Kwoniella dendrophila CBS 6074]|uniref:Uncharacterized protein n=1 Tax=Kwoniella dendrophila CBS 6074 TaxID=1295534 RepID=A0AAX4JKX3_9TREE
MPLLLSRARHILQPLKPITLSIGFSFIVPVRLFNTGSTDPNQIRCTRRLIRQPSPAASRESPYPIVFLRMKGLEGFEEEEEWVDWSAMFAERGYTSVEIDISLPESSSSSSSVSVSVSDIQEIQRQEESQISIMNKVLSTEIRLLSIPFPPLIISKGISTLLAQSFIEDFPCSGLILINPIPDEDPRSNSTKEIQTASSFKWPTFKYEPHFPIYILSTQENLLNLSTKNRLIRDYGHLPNDPSSKQTGSWFRTKSKGIEIGVSNSTKIDENGRIQVERWMDTQGF